MIAAWFIYDGRNPLGFGWQSIGTSNLDCFGSFIARQKDVYFKRFVGLVHPPWFVPGIDPLWRR